MVGEAREGPLELAEDFLCGEARLELGCVRGLSPCGGHTQVGLQLCLQGLGVDREDGPIRQPQDDLGGAEPSLKSALE